MFSKQSQGFYSFHKNPTGFSSIFQNTREGHSKNSQHVFTNSRFWQDYQNFHKIPQDFQKISSSKFSKKEKEKEKKKDKFLENLPRSSQENPAKFSNI